MSHDAALELIRREITPDLYRRICEEWKRHSIAEDNRDIPGLLSTLSPDCTYTLPQTGHTWRGHKGAAQFYQQLLGAFPDIKFDLTDIVIGPQGVWEAARVTGTHRGQWLDFAPTGRPLEFTVQIFFPWDPEREKFKGEVVYFHAPELTQDAKGAS